MDDVIVAGSGPAGALAACLLARRGLRVTLIDRARFPRPKLCGDTLNPGAVALLGRHFDLAPLRPHGLPIRGMRLSGPGGVAVRGEYGDGHFGLGVTRERFDAWLVEQALAAGARLLEEKVVEGPVVDGTGRVTGLVLRTRSGTRAVRSAAITLGADGRGSVLGRRLGLARTPAWPRRWAVGAYFDGVNGLDDLGEMHVRQAGYIGVAPTRDGHANACLVQQPGRSHRWSSPDALLAEVLGADPELAPRFRGARQLGRAVVLGPLALETPVAGRPGILLVGDAAGFIDPMTGDGIHLAMQGAELAAETALTWLGGGQASGAAHLDYVRRLRGLQARKRRFNRMLRTFVGTPSAVRLGARTARVCPAAFRALIRYAGDLPAAVGAR